MKTEIKKTILFLLLGLLLIACNKNKENPYQLPMIQAPEDNVSSPIRIELGKKLYFDPRLSGSNVISCATCHNPALGWSDGLQTSIGHNFQILERNSPTILNTAYNFLQFWDGRRASLEEQATGPIESTAEMNQDLDELIKELTLISGYRELFEKAYPKEGISKITIAKAIASFERTIISKDSNFDKWMSGKQDAISESAKRGFGLFAGKAQCVVCHSGPNFTDNGFHNIGLKSLNGKEDNGRFAVVPVKAMKGAFKTPTLRDITLTAPYMHNGIYKTLEEVIEHYDRKGDNKENLSPNMQGPLGLTSEEKKDLVEFLKTLTGKELDVTIPVLPQ
jgi:cytochrome c peroxidase